MSSKINAVRLSTVLFLRTWTTCRRLKLTGYILRRVVYVFVMLSPSSVRYIVRLLTSWVDRMFSRAKGFGCFYIVCTEHKSKSLILIGYVHVFRAFMSYYLLLLLFTANGFIPGGSGTTIHKKHKLTYTHSQNNTQHKKLQTQ